MSLYDRVHEGRPGLVICYHIGYLAGDRKHRPDRCDDANAAAHLAMGGKILLTQERLGDMSYRYLATIARSPGKYWPRVSWPDAGYFRKGVE